MRAKIAYAAGALCAVMSSGCATTLKTNHTPDGDYLRGQAYYLPRAELFVTLDRELRACEATPKSQSIVGAWLNREMLAASKYADRTLRQMDRDGINPADDDDIAAAAETLGVSEEDLKLLPMYGTTKPDKDQVAWLLVRDRVVKDSAFENPGLNADLSRQLESQIGTEFDSKLWAKSLKDPSLSQLQFDYKLVVDMNGRVKSELVSDPDHFYALDYSETGNGFKKTEYEVDKYPNGTIKSVNVILSDQSASVISSVSKGALTIALATSGLAPIPAVAGAGAEKAEDLYAVTPFKEFQSKAKSVPFCKPQVAQLLELRKSSEKAASDAAAAAASQNPEIEKLTTASTKAASEHDAKKAARQALPAGDAGIAAADAAVTKAKGEADDLAKQLAAAKKLKEGLQKNFSDADALARTYASQLTLTSMAHLSPGQTIPTPDGYETVEIVGAATAAEKWFSPEGWKGFCSAGDHCDAANIPTRLQAFAQLIGAARLVKASNNPPNNGRKSKPTVVNGVVYREPGRSLIKVCAQSPCLSGKAVALQGLAGEILSEVVVIPQYGVMAMLPFSNSSFQNNVVTAGFTDVGSVTRVKYVSNARFAEMAKSFEKVTGDFSSLQEARRDQPAKDLDAEIARTKKLTDLSREQKALADAEKARLESAAPATSSDAP